MGKLHACQARNAVNIEIPVWNKPKILAIQHVCAVYLLTKLFAKALQGPADQNHP